MILPEHGVLPVIHLQSTNQAIEMGFMAHHAGSPGAFIIDHKPNTVHDPEHLATAYQAVKNAVPELWLGLNCLSLTARDTFLLGRAVSADGIWVDDAVDINPNGTEAIDYEMVQALRRESGAAYFGGIAMKGYGYEPDPDAAANKIWMHAGKVDVAVTSGPATGQPTSSKRLARIRALNPDIELAVASGISIDTLPDQRPYIDYALVASSIEQAPLSGEIIEDKLVALVGAWKELGYD